MSLQVPRIVVPNDQEWDAQSHRSLQSHRSGQSAFYSPQMSLVSVESERVQEPTPNHGWFQPFLDKLFAKQKVEHQETLANLDDHDLEDSVLKLANSLSENKFFEEIENLHTTIENMREQQDKLLQSNYRLERKAVSDAVEIERFNLYKEHAHLLFLELETVFEQEQLKHQQLKLNFHSVKDQYEQEIKQLLLKHHEREQELRNELERTRVSAQMESKASDALIQKLQQEKDQMIAKHAPRDQEISQLRSDLVSVTKDRDEWMQKHQVLTQNIQQFRTKAKDKINDLLATSEQTLQENKTLKQDYEKTKQENEEIRQKSSHLTKENADLAEKLKQAKATESKAMESAVEAQKMYTETEGKLREMHDKMEICEQSMKRVHLKYETLKAKMQDQTSHLDEAYVKIKSLEASLEQHSQENQRLAQILEDTKTALEESEQTADNWRQECEQKDQLLSQMELELEESKQEFEREISLLESGRSYQEGLIANQTAEIKNKQSELESLKQEIQELGGHREKQKEWSLAITTANNSLGLLKSVNAELEARLEILDNERGSLLADLQSKDAKISQLENELDIMTESFEQAQQQVETLDRAVSEHQDVIEEQKRSMAAFERENTVLKSDVQLLTGALDKKKQEFDHLAQETKKDVGKVLELLHLRQQGQIQTVQDLYHKKAVQMTERLEKASEIVKKHKIRHDETLNALEQRLVDECDIREQKIFRLESEMDALQLKNELLEENFESKQHELDALLLQNQELKQETEKLLEEIQTLKQQDQEHAEQLSDVEDQLLLQIHAVQEHQQQISHLLNENKAYEGVIASLVSQVEAKVQDLESVLDHAEQSGSTMLSEARQQQKEHLRIVEKHQEWIELGSAIFNSVMHKMNIRREPKMSDSPMLDHWSECSRLILSTLDETEKKSLEMAQKLKSVQSQGTVEDKLKAEIEALQQQMRERDQFVLEQAKKARRLSIMRRDTMP